MSAKIFLRRLTDLSTFNTLQDKLSRLNDTYLVNSFVNSIEVNGHFVVFFFINLVEFM